MQISNDMPVMMLTVEELKYLLEDIKNRVSAKEEKKVRYVYGISGIARIFNCSMRTAARIKRSGKIDAAIKQIGRKIIVDADLAIELANNKRYRKLNQIW